MEEENESTVGEDWMDMYKIKLQHPIPKLWILSKPLDITFNTDGMVVQRFPFPAPVMDYIFKNLDAHQLLKLYQTCKFFYAKYRLNIIEDFKICERKSDEYIIGNTMSISYLNPSYPKLQNLWISESFKCREFEECILDLKQYSRMSIKKLDICGELSLDEFKFLVGSPFLIDLTMEDRINFYKDDSISFTQIFDLIPNVSSLYVYFPYIHPHTMNELLAIERQTKLKKLYFDRIFDPRDFEGDYFEDEILDPKLVAQFIMKNGTPDCDYNIDFEDYSEDHQKEFDKALEAELALWKLTAHQPVIFNDDNYMAAIKPVSGSINAGSTIADKLVGSDDDTQQLAIKHVCGNATDDETSTLPAAITEDVSIMMNAAPDANSMLFAAPNSSDPPEISSENYENFHPTNFASLPSKQ